MRSVFIWSVLLEDGTSKICRTGDIDNITNYGGIRTDEIISIVRIGYASSFDEKEGWIWC